MIVCSFLCADFALAQNDPYDPNSPNYVGKVKSKEKQSFWSKLNGSFGLTFFDGIKEGGEQGLIYDALVGFKVSEKARGSISMSYSHPTDLDAERPDRWEWEDLSLRLIRPSLWVSSSKKDRVNFYGTLRLPTSGTSQDASLYSSLSLRAQYTHSFRKFIFSLSPTLVLAYHEYETADKIGFIKNSPLGLNLGASLRYQATSKLGANLSTSLYEYVDYDFNDYAVQTVAVSTDYALTSKTYLSAGIRWRDRVVTNNSLFDEDAVLAYTNLTYSF